MSLALILGLNQCKKKVDPIASGTNGKWVQITLDVEGIGQKHIVYPGTGAVVYTNGDVVYVGNNGKYVGSLTYNDGVFSGSILNPSTVDYLHFYFVGNITPSTTPTAGSTTSFTVNIANQSSKLPVLSYAHSTNKYTDGTATYSCMLMNKCGLMKFVPATATSAAITVGGMKTTATVDFATPGITPNGSTGAVTLYPETNSAKWAVLLPQAAVNNPAVTISGYASSITSVPEVTNNMYYNTGVSIAMVAAATVTTTSVTTYANTSATMGGNVTSAGGGTVSERGVYYNTSSPAENGTKVQIGSGTGAFSQSVTGLTAGTTYYVKAYAVNENGKVYGSQVTFTTKSLPTVTTTAVSGISATGATSGGNVTSAGGGTVSARGVCWSTSANPTISNSHTTNGSGTGSFTSSITGLTANTTYHVRAYATNEIGTAYGADVTFTAANSVPTGAINGLFTINSSGNKVYFSQGNLRATTSNSGSTWTWSFAEHQYDYIGNATANTNINGSMTVSTNGTVDLFGWNGNSSSYDNYGIYNNTTNSNYGNVTSEALKHDWGHNPITNGGNTADKWRTLTKDEWVYVFNTRSTTSGVRYAKATVNGVSGVIILPDDWSTSYYTLSSTNTTSAAYTSNTISLSNWNTKFEANGAVFLPAAGLRGGTTVNNAGSYGYYWSSTSHVSNADRAYYVYFGSSNFVPANSYGRYYGSSVRLVTASE